MNTSSLINYKSSEREADTQTVPLAGVVLFGISTISALPSSTSFFPAGKKKETADKTDIVMLGGGYNHFHILSLVIWSNMQPVEQAPSACNAMCDHACGMRVNSTSFLQVFQYALVK